MELRSSCSYTCVIFFLSYHADIEVQGDLCSVSFVTMVTENSLQVRGSSNYNASQCCLFKPFPTEEKKTSFNDRYRSYSSRKPIVNKPPASI